MILLAFIASWTICFLLGFLVRGLLEAEHQRRIPEHPTIRGGRVQQQPQPWRLHIVSSDPLRGQQPFDQDKELRAE